MKELPNAFTVFINVKSVETFPSSYDGTAGNIHADAIYKIKKSDFLYNSVNRVCGGSFPVNTNIYDFEELTKEHAIRLVRETVEEIFPDIFINDF